MMAYTMVRMQVQLGEQQLEVLRGRAARGHASVSDLVRRAVDGWIASQAGNEPCGALPARDRGRGQVFLR